MEDDKVFDLLTKMYGNINNRFDKMDSRFDSLEKEVKNIGAKIDGELIPKQQALFDGYVANTEKLSELTESLEDIKTEVNNISIKTLKNENSIIHIKRQISGRV